MISKYFIDRPVLANVIAWLIVVIGLVSLFRLPVAQYPDIVPPTIQVTARYPGASASTVAREVGLPIEERVNGTDGMLYMSSQSTSDGQYTLTVTFAIGTDPDKAEVLVQNRVQTSLASLPDAVQSQGVQTTKRSTAILEIVALTSPKGSYDSLYLANYASINMQDDIARIEGVGAVSVFGAGQYAMRIWLDPEKMQARTLVPADVVNAINQQNVPEVAGQLGLPPVPVKTGFQYTLNVSASLATEKDFGDIILKGGTSPGSPVTRVRDVARIELGAQQYSQQFMLDGKPAAGLAIFQLPSANALTVAKAVAGQVTGLAKAFPQDMTWSVPFDTTRFVQAAIGDVYRTLIEAALLVLAVILLFLHNWRAMMVPATTVPVTIIGAFAAMAALGYSVNLTTLFAIILAIGIVVDDAIVVVEGATKYIEEGMSPREAAIRAMGDLLGPIIGITLVLMAIFLPASFLPGLSGQMYRQFALVIAATALISAVNAITLKPTQCAAWLRAKPANTRPGVLARGFIAGYDAVERRYVRLITLTIRHAAVMGMMLMLLLGLALWSLARVPTAFLPIEDQGYFLVSVDLPPGASLGRTAAALQDVDQRLKKVPDVAHVVTISGLSALNDNSSASNSGIAYVIFTDWSKRKAHLGLLQQYDAINKAVQNLTDGSALVIPPPPIQGVGNASGATLKVELHDGTFDYHRLESYASRIVKLASAAPEFMIVRGAFNADSPQFDLQVNRLAAETAGVTFSNAIDTMSSYVGGSYAGQFERFGRVYQIYVQADAPFRLSPSSVSRYALRNASGSMVPLGAIASIAPMTGPATVNLYNLRPAATIITNQAAGYSSGQGLDTLDGIAASVLPLGTGSEWTALSFLERQVGSQIYIAYGLGLLLIYLVLAAQYHSWIAPLAVIASVPLALLGSAGALLALGVANNLYCQIGMILLIALSSKNAILIVEYARDLHERDGRPIEAAATEAARLRLRPILMTSIAFILGVVPLLLASGAGSSAQKSIGLVVITGMLASTLLTVSFVPSVYSILQRAEDWWTGRTSANI